MAKQIILASHARLAKGFAESLSFIFKPQDRIHTICAFTELPDPGKAFDDLYITFDERDTVIVLTDLLGGSVNKMIAERLKNKKFYLISGINLALLLEIACAEEKEVNDDFICKAIDNSRNDMKFMNDAIASYKDEKEDSFF